MFSFIRRAPLVLPCLFFVLGILLQFECEFQTAWHNLTMLVCAAAFILCIYKKALPSIQVYFLLWISFSGGITAAGSFQNKTKKNPTNSIYLKFQIEKKLKNNQFIAGDQSQQFLVGFDKSDSIQCGQTIEAIGEFQAIALPKLPWNFNQKKQMLSNGITHEFKVREIKSITHSNDIGFAYLPQNIQYKLQHKITTAFPDTSTSAILSALLLGETTLLTKEISSDYSVAGVVHILAVSGMHVALIYELILLLLKLFLRKKRKWLTFTIAMTLLWSYGAITGFSASVVRACCMFSFFVISDCFLLPRNTGNTIAGSTILILFFQPFLIYNLGFLLSITAVLGIVIIHPMIIKRLYTENKILYYLATSASITLSAQLATLPLTLYIFHSFPTYFLIANLILVPWSTLILYLGIAFLFLSEIPFLGELIVFILKMTTQGMNDLIHLIQYLPHAQLSKIPFNFEQAILAYVLLICIGLFVIFKYSFFIHATGVATLLIIGYSYAVARPVGYLFTHYQSNLLLLGNEKELILACDNDTISSQYIEKLNSWKCQQNRTNHVIHKVDFPTSVIWHECENTRSLSLFHGRNKHNIILLEDEMKKQKIDSLKHEDFLNKKILFGKGVSRKKREYLTAMFQRNNIPYQNIQSEPFILKY
jgi:ComEC/Rec2-related protein